MKTSLQILAGTISLAIAGGAFANTSGDQNGTIFLNIDDTKDNTSFVFDTGLSTASFTGTTPYSHNLSGDANYASFLASVTDPAFLEYSVIAGGGNPTIPTTPKEQVLFSSSSGHGSNIAGSNVTAAYNAIAQALLGAANPAGGSTFIPASSSANGWASGGFEGTLNANFVAGDGNIIGSPLAFYSATTNNPKSVSIAASLSTFAGVWNLTSAGLLTYTLPTPLPAPLVLLLSGLGLMGLIARRGRSGANEPQLGMLA